MSQRILRATPATITCGILDADGTLTAPAATLTVTITRADGTILAADRATTQAQADGIPIVGVYSAGLTATETASLDLLTCVWADGTDPRVTTHVEIGGGYYFSVADVRGFDKSLVSETTYPDELILAARREVEDECERITACAWVPRYGKKIVDSHGGPRLCVGVPLLRSVRTVEPLIGTALDVDGIDIDEASRELVKRSGLFPCGRITVTYEHGANNPPSDLRHAALTRLREILNREKSGLPANATSFTPTGGGVFSIAQPGRSGFKTGNPDVDAVYLDPRYCRKLPGIA